MDSVRPVSLAFKGLPEDFHINNSYTSMEGENSEAINSLNKAISEARKMFINDRNTDGDSVHLYTMKEPEDKTESAKFSAHYNHFDEEKQELQEGSLEPVSLRKAAKAFSKFFKAQMNASKDTK